MNENLKTEDIRKKVKSVKRRKWFYSSFMVAAVTVVFWTVYALILPAITITPEPEAEANHPTLSYMMYSDTEKTLRAYLEYSLLGSRKDLTQGVVRQSVLYVYAYAGETICLGSDVTQSLIDINDNVPGVNLKNGSVGSTATPTGADIVVVGPDGTLYAFDNDAETGLGYIGTSAQEAAGANYTGSNNTEGYTPHEFVARETGIYEVRFHSYTGACDTVANDIPHLKDPTVKENTGNKEYKVDGSHVSKQADPVPTKKSSDVWYNSGCTVGAFDITVVSEGKVKTGRTYSRLLALNMGVNTSSNKNPTFYGDFYIVTDDGYIYRNKYQLDPYGFIFFVNSRGIVDDVNGYSAYHSIRGKGQDSNAQIDMVGLERYSFYNPQSEDSFLDKTHMIFFELPDPDLQGVVYERAYAPDRIESLEFIGSKEGNITYVGNGGYFKFDIENAVSVTITIDFASYNAEHGTNHQNVSINANVTKGTNYVYWDGFDGAGDPVPVGWYENGQINVKIEAHAGEFHFPFLDVECSGGISYERVNSIYEYVDGELIDVSARYADTKFKVYYNNTTYEDGRNSPGGLQIGDALDCSSGVDSESLVMRFGTHTVETVKADGTVSKSTVGLGDYTVLDVWTYASSSTDVEIKTDIVVEDIEGYYTVTLEGLVFFDKDDNTKYELIGGDFPLKDVEVSLDYYYCGTRWSIERNDDGEIIALHPTYKSTSEFDDDGISTHEVILYYYHNYEVIRDEEGLYRIYEYAFSDTLHEGTPTIVTDAGGNPISVEIYEETTTELVPVEPEPSTEPETEPSTEPDITEPDSTEPGEESTTEPGGETSTEPDGTEPDGTEPESSEPSTEPTTDPAMTEHTITTYCVWIPVHRETTTSVLGKYYFPGVLVNENMYSPPEGMNTDFVITVTNPDPNLYELTTMNAVTGDFGTCGIDESQVIALATVEAKIQADIAALGDAYNKDLNRNFTYELADVGYYYPTYEPPLTIAKKWGTDDNYKDIQSVFIGLEGYITKENGDKVVYYNREIKLDYYSWNETLTDLPAYALVNGEDVPLSYRVTYERFTKGSNNVTYLFTYDRSTDPPEGKYWRYVYDGDGNVIYDEDEHGNSSPRLQLLSSRADYPFETFIYELKRIHTGDYIYVENWTSDTCSIKITKIGADDDVSLLENATFLLQKRDPSTGRYEDVITAQGKYTITTDVNGIAIFHGLSEGTYRLVEIVPPDFYSAVDPITFVVSKDEETGTHNADVTGSYYDDYAITIYDHLLEHPVSIMHKIDQYGRSIAGAKFAFYKARDDYSYTEDDLIYLDSDRQIPAIVTFDSQGTATLEKSIDGKPPRSLYISELQALLDGNNKFVLKEIEIPNGYRGIGEAHMRITGDKLSSFIICDNPYESGVWVEPLVTVYAPETLQVVDMTQLNNISSASYVNSTTGEIDYVQYTDNGNITSKGTLFAVVVKRNGAEPNQGDMNKLTFEDWAPVYGNAIDGYHTISNSAITTSLERVCELINMTEDHDNVYEFKANTNGTLMYTKVENLPDRVERYFTYMNYNHMQSVWRDDIDPGYYSDPQFAVLYYYSTASSIEEVTPTNTARVTSHGLYNEAEKFTTHFATDILIPDISNNLYIQKSNVQDDLINNAVFGMYDAVADENGNGYYVVDDAVNGKVYITLSEDNKMTAKVYSGTVNDDGVLNQKALISTGTYSFITDGCEDIAGMSEQLLHDASNGYVSLIEGISNDVGTIVVSCGGAGTYNIEPAKSAMDIPLVVYTHDECNVVSQTGTGHFRYLNKGKYFIRELYAPVGFDLNYTNIEVFIGDEEVYANAGEMDDGVMVGNGAGYVVSTLNQFASKGDIRETLTYIVAAMRLNPDYSTRAGFTDLTGHMTWPYVSLDRNNTLKYIFDGNERTGAINASTVLYLMYNGSSNEEDLEHDTIFDYCVNPDGATNPANTINSLLFWTRSGWSDLAIFQHKTAADDSDVNNPEVLYTDISLKNNQPNDISLLFSGSTFVRVADNTKIGLQLRKIDSAKQERLENAKFVLYRTDADGINIYYSADEDGNPMWNPLEEGQTEEDLIFSTDVNGEYLFKKLDTGKYYLKEVLPPAGYSVLPYQIVITVTGDNIKAVYENGQPVSVIAPQSMTENDELWLYTIVVPNDLTYMLPETGGSGSSLYTYGGLTLIVTASVIYIYSNCIKRRKREQG